MQKESLTQVVKEFEKEKELMKHHYDEEITKLKHEIQSIIGTFHFLAIALTEQLKIRNKEFKHVKGLAQMILDQRSEVETFFLESLEQVKHEYHKRANQDRKEVANMGGIPTDTVSSASVITLNRRKNNRNMETKWI